MTIPRKGERLIQRLLPLVTIVLAAAACSRDISIKQAYATCRESGKDTSDVTLAAFWSPREGWFIRDIERPPEPSSHKRYTVNADFGPKTPMMPFQVRIEDDHDIFRNPPPPGGLKFSGTFVCKDPRGRSVLLGYYVPTSMAIDKSVGQY